MKLLHYCALCTIVLGVLSLREALLLSERSLTIRICETGQGDAIIIRTPSSKFIVVDGGPNLDILTDLGEMMPWFNRTIDLLVLTHPDLDHVTALPSILERYTVRAVLLTGIDGNSGKYAEFLHQLKSKQTPVLTVAATKTLEWSDGVTLQVLWPTTDLFGTKSTEPNDTSVVVKVAYNGQSMLLTGDIGKEAEAELLATGVDVESTYLKVPHHGSTTSSSTGFLLAVKPTLAIASAGKDNPFNHPHIEILERYRALHIPVWNTAVQGDFEVRFR